MRKNELMVDPDWIQVLERVVMQCKTDVISSQDNPADSSLSSVVLIRETAFCYCSSYSQKHLALLLLTPLSFEIKQNKMIITLL